MINFFDIKPEIKIEEIEIIENSIGLKFPVEYKLHLLKYNGGRCKPNIFNFFEKGKLTQSNIEWFFAIHKEKNYNLLNYIQFCKLNQKRLPKHIFPFGRDAFGNLICLSCGEKDYGKVFFWDHENEVDYEIEGDDNYDNLYLIANSFNDFLNSLE